MKNFELKDGETYAIYYTGDRCFPSANLTLRQFALMRINLEPGTVTNLTFLGYFWLEFEYEKTSKKDILDYMDRFVGSILTKKSFEDWINTFKEDGIDIIGI